MKKLFAGIVLLTAMLTYAEVQPGENLILNPDLEADQIDFPVFWSVQGKTDAVSYISTGGPNGKGYLKFYSEQPMNEEVSVRQYGVTMKAGERYRLSAMVRTKGFKSPHKGFSIANYAWHNEIGIREIPENQEWTLMEKEFELMKSSNGSYFFTVFACRFVGEFDVAELKCEAISEGALKHSSPSAMGQLLLSATLIPWSPLLHAIPDDTRQLSFRLFGKLSNLADLDLVVAPSDSQATLKQPLQANINTITLPRDAKGGTLHLAIVNRTTGKEVKVFSFPYSVVRIPKVDAKSHKQLNNLVTEVLNSGIRDASQEFTFSTLKNGWVFFAVKNADASQLKVTLDGKEVIIDAESPRLEAFREIGIGEHTLAIEGGKGGSIVVRSIVDIFNYCPGSNNIVSENPPYDWDFQMKYGMPAITTQNGGNIPEDKRDWFHAHGYKWLANLNSTNLKDDQDLTHRLEKCKGMMEAWFDGVTCDEQFFSNPIVLQRYTAGLKGFANPDNKLIYTWIVGKPTTSIIDHDFMATSVNASGGRGKLIIEAYCRTKPTLQEAREYLNYFVTDNIRRFKRYYPNVEKSTGVIFGNFNQVPILSLAHHPEVDFKYYLDMQLNLVANDPEFKNLGGTGYWGSYYADHELHRWAYMLLRHYCIEGNTTMLSDQYGYSYIPNHVINGDFRGSFEGWTATGNVTLDQHKTFAAKSQNRWGGNNGIGDTFAVLSKKEDETSTLTQNAVNLVPGKAYCLQFATFDVDDVKSDTINGRKFGITARLSKDAEIREDLSWHHIDKRIKGRYRHNDNVARINLQHIVFIAKAPSVNITLDNAAALKGENLGINYLSVKPFLLEE